MPIPVECPGCHTQLTVPDAVAGKSIKCSKCQTVVAVPEPLSLDDDEPAEAPPAKKSAAVRKPFARKRRDDDDDDDLDRGRPLSFREKRAAAAGGPPVAVVFVVAGLIGLGIVGGVLYTGYALFFSGKETASGGSGGRSSSGGGRSSSGSSSGGGQSGGGSGGKAAVPDGWKQVTSRSGGFKAYFPTDAKEQPLNASPSAKKIGQPPFTGAMLITRGRDDSKVAVAMGFKFRPGVSPAERERVVSEFTDAFTRGGPSGGVKVLDQRDVTWLGQGAKELVVDASGPDGAGQLVVRMVVVGSTAYVGVIGAKGGRPRPEDENGFFDNFEVLN